MGDSKRSASCRDGKRFALVPHVVMDSPAYLGLPHPARSLLLELTRQFNGKNNGQLVLCEKALSPRGWKSTDVIHRAKRNLLDAGLIQETRKGQRPNKASWYALTWSTLNWTAEMDIQRKGYERTAYLKKRPPPDGVSFSRVAPSGEG